MVAQQEERASTRATTSTAIEQFRAKRQARLANRSREGRYLASPHTAPTNSTQSTAMPAADLVGRPSPDIIEAGLTGIIGHSAWRVPFPGVTTHPRTREVSRSPIDRSAKGGAPPRRADAETDTEVCVRIRRVVVTQSVKPGRPAADRESLQDGAGGWWLVLLQHMRVNGSMDCRKLDGGVIPTDTTGRTNWSCALAEVVG
ncbi:hypothetical protein CNMCM5623_006772 [Aspergillus felis]|uniref:Uncharacterized protein n=1 Tax=Aspergillus felis TaxID=1287682 RepID=A0A8H6QKM2_9EURO|nr:hypothetical protein CNMCM5623_006772 [Aspergillus felis]